MIAVIGDILEASVPGFHLFQFFNFLHWYFIHIHLSHVVLSTHHHSLYQYFYVNPGDSQTSQEQFGQVCILHTHSVFHHQLCHCFLFKTREDSATLYPSLDLGIRPFSKANSTWICDMVWNESENMTHGFTRNIIIIFTYFLCIILNIF